jgi:zinc protease
MASLTFDQIVYAGHPYSRPDDGFPETIRAILREDLAEYHRRYYGPRGMVLIVVGAVEPQQAVEKVARVLGDWRNLKQPEAPPLPPLPVPAEPAVRKVAIPGKFQADLVVGAAGPERRSPEFLAAALGNNVLGVFGMMGRVGEVVREKAGLAYYAYSSLSGGSGPGPWYVSAGVDPGNIEQALELIKQEIARFNEVPVSAEELSDSQSNFIGRLPLSLETNGGMASSILNLERFELGLDYYQRYPGLVRAVTREDILETARRYLSPDRLGVGIAGP